MSNLFEIGGSLKKSQSVIFSILGFIVIIVGWYATIILFNIKPQIFPMPHKVISALIELYKEYNIISNTWYSIKLNFYGYIEAILISIPLGFVVGLFPIFNGMFSKWVNSVRFLPLTAVTGIFIGIFGIALDMKVHFLSFGIIIYLLPIFVSRVEQTDMIHRQTMHTIGANKWQKFRYLYFPSVMSKIFTDIKVIVAISWTYIIVAELIARDLGVGALIWKSEKMGRVDMVFAILVVIIFVGYLSDLLFNILNYIFFPHLYESSQVKTSIWSRIFIPTFFGKYKDWFIKEQKTEQKSYLK